MFDKRVVRGNTYAAQILPAVSASPTPRVTRPSSDSRESKLARGRAHVSSTNCLLLLGGSLRLLPLTPRRVRSAARSILTRHCLPTISPPACASSWD